MIVDIPKIERFLPLLDDVRWKGSHGGRGSGKSHDFAGDLLDLAMTKQPLRWLCVREHQVSLKHSVKQLLEDKIRQYKLTRYFDSKLSHIITPGGGIINFVGMKNHTSDSVKSYEGYDGAWCEEAQRLSRRSFDLLYPTIRKPGSQMWFSWNPDQATDPVDDFFRGKGAAAIDPRIMRVVESNYTHNPFLSKEMLGDIEIDRHRDPDRFAWIWKGAYNKKSSTRVFKNWRIGDLDEFPVDWSEFPRLYFGGDFGFATDPTVLICLAVVGRRIYILAECYMVGCEIDHTPLLFGGLDDFALKKKNEKAWESINVEDRHLYRGIPGSRRWPVIADSARPETISYLKRHGFPLVEPSRKGPGSIEEGVTFLQSYDIIVHPDCTHCIDELTFYSYKTDPKTEEVLPILEDKKNHVIDAIRYAIEKLRRAKGGVY